MAAAQAPRLGVDRNVGVRRATLAQERPQRAPEAGLFAIGRVRPAGRRLGQPEPPNPASFDSFNRNRNFYPYPQTERDNNPNTPANPSI